MDIIDIIGMVIGVAVVSVMLVRWLVSRFVRRGMEQAAKEDLKEWD